MTSKLVPKTSEEVAPLKQRKRAVIVREGERAALKFDEIKHLAAQWEPRPVPTD